MFFNVVKFHLIQGVRFIGYNNSHITSVYVIE